jgi:hypothetical protein
VVELVETRSPSRMADAPSAIRDDHFRGAFAAA